MVFDSKRKRVDPESPRRLEQGHIPIRSFAIFQNVTQGATTLISRSLSLGNPRVSRPTPSSPPHEAREALHEYLLCSFRAEGLDYRGAGCLRNWTTEEQDASLRSSSGSPSSPTTRRRSTSGMTPTVTTSVFVGKPFESYYKATKHFRGRHQQSLHHRFKHHIRHRG